MELELLYPEFEFAIAALSLLPASSTQASAKMKMIAAYSMQPEKLDAVEANGSDTHMQTDGKETEVMELGCEQMVAEKVNAMVRSGLIPNLSAR